MIGTVLNHRYRLDSEIGRGAMGVVYRGSDGLLNRDVAVKVLPRNARSTESHARMLDEARAVAVLNHPNIVTVFDAGETDQSAYIVMEVVEGVSLREKMPLEITDCISVAQEVCAALTHAHAHTIVHRDLKPENVLLSGQGLAKLVDFGIAQSGSAAEAGKISGTIHYMAPEQIRGQTLDGRADLYSFGIMLYEMVTGRLPFTAGDWVSLVFQHQYGNVPPPAEVDPAVPGPLNDLIVALLQKSPEDRPRSAEEVQAVLDELASMNAASRLLEKWRASGAEFLSPANLEILSSSTANLSLDKSDLVFLFQSALFHGIEIAPWIRRAGATDMVRAVFEELLLHHPNERVRTQAAESVLLLEGTHPVDLLFETAISDPSPQVRAAAALAASRAGYHQEMSEELCARVVETEDPGALAALAAVADEIGVPENLVAYPKFRVGMQVFNRRWRAHRRALLRQTWWGAQGVGALLGLFGAAAPAIVYFRSPVDFADTIQNVTLPGWILIGVVGFMVFGILQGFAYSFVVGLSEMFPGRKPGLRRMGFGGAAGLFYGLILVTVFWIATEYQRPPTAPWLYNTMSVVYGISVGAVLTIVIPPFNHFPGLQKIARAIVWSAVLAVSITVPYVQIVFGPRAAGMLPLWVVTTALVPVGIGLGIARGHLAHTAETGKERAPAEVIQLSPNL